MAQIRPMLAAISLLITWNGLAADEKLSGEPMPLEEAAVYFEQNATDKDAEVVFEATAGDAGLATLQVVSAKGRTIVDFKAPDSKLGIRQFCFESPEPENDGTVQAGFPRANIRLQERPSPASNFTARRGSATSCPTRPP